MLYIIPTPIWNREDITLRWLRLLKELNIFFCEDTRTTKDLMKLYDIDYSSKQFYSFTTFTSPWKINHYINLIKDNNVWLVSEAGTPWLSDPGKELIRICWENNIQFDCIPWANALVPAVVWSGFDTSEFIYLGFLPTKKWRQTKLKFITQSEIPVFVYESVHRFEKLIQEAKDLWFNWKISVFRELTKMFEQKECWTIDEILDKVKNWKIVIKGEFVVWFYNFK